MIKTMTVYSVIVDTKGDGTAYDDSGLGIIIRFRNLEDARAFAHGKRAGGHPAVVQTEYDVPARLAARWGI